MGPEGVLEDFGRSLGVLGVLGGVLGRFLGCPVYLDLVCLDIKVLSTSGVSSQPSGGRLGPFPGLVGVQIGPQIDQKSKNSVPNGSRMVPRKVRGHCENRGLPIQVPFFNLKSLLLALVKATFGKQ